MERVSVFRNRWQATFDVTLLNARSQFNPEASQLKTENNGIGVVTPITLGHAKNWIDGQWKDASKHSDSINPATGEVIGTYADGGLDEATSCVAAAVRAFNHSDWKDNRVLRARVLTQIADRFEARCEELAQVLSLENGKILPQARSEVGGVASKFRYWSATVLTEYGRVAELTPGHLSFVTRSPVGVAGIIAPFNSPVMLTVRSLAPALAAGTTTAVKMPGKTSQINRLFSEIISEAPDLPRGVINIFTESGSDGSAFLVATPDVPVISFTGSSKTGKAISAVGAANLKRFGLELGGKTPMLVFEDVDIEKTVPRIVTAFTTFAGQFCMTGSRLLVQRSIADRFRDALVRHVETLKIGPASDPTSDVGPLIDRPNVTRVNKMVDDAITAGAKVIVRGGPITQGSLSLGAFYRPTVLEVTDPGLVIMQEEVFGPVLAMMTFDSEREAIELANNSAYGLAASIWTRDVDRPFRVGRELDCGTVWVNDWAVVYDEFEEGGYKASGLGRLNGVSAIDDFLIYKHLAFHSGTVGDR